MQIKYIFNYQTADPIQFVIQMDDRSLDLLPEECYQPPVWTELSNNQCKNCPLTEAQAQCCPIAVNISHIAEKFANEKSYLQTQIAVETENRTYLKTTSLQMGLFSLFGLIMSTSGCPHMDFLRTMARFHLPFSTLEETLIRTVSIYLLKQYFKQMRGEEADFDLKELNAAYQRVNVVNQGIINRIRTITHGDANSNAILILDACASMLSMSLDTQFEDIEPLIQPSRKVS